MECGKKPAEIFSIPSKCSLIVGVSMVLALRCHWLNVKDNIIKCLEVSRFFVAISFIIFNIGLCYREAKARSDKKVNFFCLKYATYEFIPLCYDD